LECRIYHGTVGSVGGAAAFHCNHTFYAGGPCSGTIATGTDHYCDLLDGACAPPNRQYNTLADCRDSFTTFNDSTVVSTGSANNRGNRQYHAQAVVALNVLAHCQHAGPSGGGVIGTPHDSWRILANIQACKTANLTLTSNSVNQIFAAWSPADLNTSVPAGNAGSYNVGSSGNTALCRLYHMTVATNALTHCSHGDLFGTDVNMGTGAVTTVCGTSLADNACLVVQTACGTRAFATTAACTTAIGALLTNATTIGMPGDTTMNTFACRMYHAGVGMAAKAGGAATMNLLTSSCNAVKSVGGCGSTSTNNPTAAPTSSAPLVGVATVALFLPLFA
jgi:hypothetical protein